LEVGVQSGLGNNLQMPEQHEPPVARDRRALSEAKRKRPVPEDALWFARALRHGMTDPEQMMWAMLRDRRMQNMKFRRQHPLPPYTLDFYCHQLLLVVEIDGSQHLDSPSDARRDAFLRELGIKTIRYWNHDVINRTEEVLEDIWSNMLARADCLSPFSPREKGRG
jgi:very-short-patch-repair endonuclease